jgi:uncharacterized membrane protein
LFNFPEIDFFASNPGILIFTPPLFTTFAVTNQHTAWQLPAILRYFTFINYLTTLPVFAATFIRTGAALSLWGYAGLPGETYTCINPG